MIIIERLPAGLAPTAKGKFARMVRVRRRAPSGRQQRLNEAERKSLGLQRGVGYNENDLTRARFYRALEQLIAREVRDANLSPLMQIGFDGRSPTIIDEAQNPRRLPEAGRAQRNTSSSPLDYLYFQSKKPLQYWEWCVGKRFEYDFQRSRIDGPVTLSLDSMALAKIEKPTKEERRRRERQTFKPRAGKRMQRVVDVADTRLDAMARVGRLADEVSKISFWLLEQVVGYERTLSEVGNMLGTDQRYVAQRFREALIEAGLHYRMCPGAKPRARR